MVPWQKNLNHSLEDASTSAATSVGETGQAYHDDSLDFIEQIPQFAEKHRRMARDIFGVDFDYSAESIQRLDEVIDMGWQHTPIMLDAVVLPLGCYLGETVRRLHGAQWKHTDDCGYYLDEIGGQDVQLFPFSTIKKRFCSGRSESLDYFYNGIAQHIEPKVETRP